MTTYTVAIKSGESGDTSQSTQELDDALDWFTNACTAVMDSEDDVESASLSVDGLICGIIQEPGEGDDGRVVELKRRKVA